jgi:hypothetical protein
MSRRWTIETAIEAARTCTGYDHFHNTYGGAYEFLRRNNRLDGLFDKRVEEKWTEDLLHEKAALFQTRSDFAKAYPGGMKAALRLGVIDNLFPSKKRFVTEDMIRYAVSQCSHVGEFRKLFPSEYSKAIKLGVVRDLLPIRKVKNWRFKWDELAIRKAASECSTRQEFYDKYGSAYNAARQLGILENVIGYSFNQWTHESVIEESKKYSSKKDFQKHCKGAYAYAHRHDMIDDLFVDQSRCNTRCCVYIWSVVGDTGLYKIGITSKNMNVSRIDMVAKKANMKYEVVILAQVGSENARKVEKLLKQQGVREKFVEKFDGHTEFRRLSPSDVSKCFEIISQHVIERIL